MDIIERPAPASAAERVRPQRIEPLPRDMLQHRIQLARDEPRGPSVERRGDQFRCDAAEGAIEDEFRTGPEIEREALELDLGGFRRVDSVQLAFLDSDNAFRQPFALQLALAQDEIETRALGAAVVEVDPGPQRAGNRPLRMLELSQLRDQRRGRG